MTRVQHEVTADCAGEHCHSHNIDEPGRNAYIVCPECGHVYRTAAALWLRHLAEIFRLFWHDLRHPFRLPADLAAHVGWQARWPRVAALLVVLRAIGQRPSRILSCAHCIHDF